MQPMTKKKHTTTSKRSPARSPSLSPPLESRRRVGGQSPERLHGNAPPTPPPPPLPPSPSPEHTRRLSPQRRRPQRQRKL
uniref:B2 n=1 Tax=Human betaherpesvirus 6 TaxID=10368 RepID=A0A1W6GA89_9BETA|nr:hypothetical protein [Human betaherpesvirus 6]QFX48857.1 hypothetical protein [Human betaherpesvirus 6]